MIKATRNYLVSTTLIALTILQISCTASAVDQSCEAWLDNAVKSIEAQPMENRYRAAAAELTISCSLIPDNIKKIAATIANDRDSIYAAVQENLGEYYSPSCLEEDLTQPASKLLHTCIEPEDKDGGLSSLLENIEAADYLFIAQVRKELRQNKLPATTTDKFINNFSLSAAVNNE